MSAVEPPTSFTIEIQRDRVMTWLWRAVIGLIAIHSTLTIIHYTIHELPWLVRQMFDVDEEYNLPTWFSGSLLLITAQCIWMQARASRLRVEKMTPYWYGLAIGFGFLSLDEVAGFHETLNSLTPFSWAIPGAVFAALIGGAYLQFLFSLPRPLALRFFIGGAIYIGGAIGVELATEPFLENDALDTLAYNLSTSLEEGMEMSGVLVFLSALLGHMAGQGLLTPAVKVVPPTKSRLD